MGRHAPIGKTFQDGIMKIGKKYAQKLSNESVDGWFSDVAHFPEVDKLKLYAQFCKAYVGKKTITILRNHILFYFIELISQQLTILYT